MNRTYAFNLAREIIETKEVVFADDVSMDSDDKTFWCYTDNYIEVVLAKNTKALQVTIKKDLAPSGGNPVIYVNDEGECYRYHSETGYFIMYAERLLGRDITIGLSPYNIKAQRKIDEMLATTDKN